MEGGRERWLPPSRPGMKVRRSSRRDSGKAKEKKRRKNTKEKTGNVQILVSACLKVSCYFCQKTKETAEKRGEEREALN